MAERSASVRVDPSPTFSTASSVKSSIVPRALPSAAAAIDSAKNPKIGNRYSGRSSTGPPNRENARSAGTTTSSATASWLPVPRRPRVCQVSSTFSCSFGSATTIGSGRDPSAGGSAGMHPANSTPECEMPLQNAQRPDTARPPSTGLTLPRGAHTPAAMKSGSPNSSRRGPSGR